METLKIAFYTDSYLPSRDGVVTSILNTRAELERRGHEVYVFASGGKKTAALAKKDKHLSVIKGIKFNKYPQYTIGLKTSENSRIFHIQPDIIHAHTPFNAGLFGYRASAALGTKFIGTFHTMVFSEDAISSYLTKNRTAVRISRYFMLRYLKWFYSKTDSIIAPTDYVKKALNNHGMKNVIVIPTGMDFSSLRMINRKTARNALNIKQNDKVILYFGRVSKEKNVELLIKSAKPLSAVGFRIVIAGAGPLLKELARLNKKIGNKNTKFAGFVREEDLPNYYAAADMFCNPSKFETQGLVNLYAAFYGLPILMPAGTAQEELLKYSKCGETFNPNSIRNLVDTANKIYDSKDSYRFGRIVREFDIKKTVDKLLSLYRHV